MTKRGRPPLDGRTRGVTICLTVPPARYDALYRQAQLARVTIPEWIRRHLPRAPPAPANNK